MNISNSMDRNEDYIRSDGIIMACLLTLVILISFSRLALGRHYMSDIVAGALIGYYVEFAIAQRVFMPVFESPDSGRSQSL